MIGGNLRIARFVSCVVEKIGGGETSKSYGWTPCEVCGKYCRHDNNYNNNIAQNWGTLIWRAEIDINSKTKC